MPNSLIQFFVEWLRGILCIGSARVPSQAAILAYKKQQEMGWRVKRIFVKFKNTSTSGIELVINLRFGWSVEGTFGFCQMELVTLMLFQQLNKALSRGKATDCYQVVIFFQQSKNACPASCVFSLREARTRRSFIYAFHSQNCLTILGWSELCWKYLNFSTLPTLSRHRSKSGVLSFPELAFTTRQSKTSLSDPALASCFLSLEHKKLSRFKASTQEWKANGKQKTTPPWRVCSRKTLRARSCKTESKLKT